MKRLWPICLLAFAACGDEDALTSIDGPSRLDVRLDARGAGEEQECGGSAPVDLLEAQAFPAGGSDGIRLATDCRRSSVDYLTLPDGAPLPAGVYDVEVLALGFLRGLRNQVLYSGTRRVQVPGPAQIILQPEVAFVEVDWTLPPGSLPCEEGIDAYEVRVISDSRAEPLMARTADCASVGFAFDDPIRPGAWTIVVEGLDESRVRYARSEERFLDRGLNALSLGLRPTGAQLALDWSFDGPDSTSRGCDIASVDEVEIDVRWRDQVESYVLPCAAERPRVLDGLHLPVGAVVQVDARADGAALYRGSASFTVMAQGELDRLLVLEPFGRVDIAWALSGLCEDVGVLELRIEDLVHETVFVTEVDPQKGGFSSPELPFSAYRFLLQAPEQPGCRVGGLFTLETAYLELPEVVVPNPP